MHETSLNICSCSSNAVIERISVSVLGPRENKYGKFLSGLFPACCVACFQRRTTKLISRIYRAVQHKSSRNCDGALYGQV